MSRVRALARRLACERGYSLPELIAVMAIMTTILTTLTGLFVSGSRSQLDLNDRVQAQNNAVVGLGRLRRDVHCASAVTSWTAQTLVLASSCVPSGTVSWCTTLTSTGRYALRRRPTSGTCGASDALLADYLTTNTLFAYQDSPAGGTRTKLKATLVVRAPEMQTPYTLCDVLVLRNVKPTTGTATVTPC